MQFLLEPFDHRAKFLALFLVWTLCLGLTTLSVQHSQNPMICAPFPQCRVAPPPNQPIPPPPGKRHASTPSPTSTPVPSTKPTECHNRFIPIVAGTGSGVAAGAGASALASAGVISTTMTVGGAVVAAPATVAVATGIVIFLVVRSLTGAC